MSEIIWNRFLKILSGIVLGVKFLMTYLQDFTTSIEESTQNLTVPLINSKESMIVKTPSALFSGFPL